MTTPPQFYTASGDPVDLPPGVAESLSQNPLVRKESSVEAQRDPLNTSGIAQDLQWGRKSAQTASHRVVLSSGSVVRVRRLEITDLIGMGLTDILDTFSQNIFADDKADTAEKAGEALMMDPSKLSDVMGMVNKIAAKAVVEPKVHLASQEQMENADLLDEDLIYAHLIPLEDRFEIFGAALPEMEDTFRPSEGSTRPVADVENGEGL